MSWDHQAYSFGYSNARPLTPRRTPTTAGSGFETPRNVATNSGHSGLNPTFPKNYAGFSRENHLSADHDSADKTQTTLSAGHGFYPLQPSTAELISPVENVSYDTRVSSPAVGGLRSMAETSQTQVTQHWGHGSQFEATPQNQDYVNSRTTSQVITPPGTESRGHFSKPYLDMMQDPFYTGDQLPQLAPPGLSTFPTSNGDVCGFPLSAPAATNLSSGSADNFWALDTSMSGVNMSFENSHTDFMGLPGKPNHSFDWGSNTQAAQNEAAMSFSYEAPPSQPAFDFSKNFSRASITTTEPLDLSPNTNVPNFQDPFASATSNSGLDTESLFGLTTSSSMDLQPPLLTSVASAPPKQLPFYPPPKQDSQNIQKAYAHSRPTSAASLTSRNEKSPAAVAKVRPGMVRSMIDTRSLGNACRPGQSNIKPFSESRNRTANERSHNNLFPIPETTSKKRSPSIIFTIDANGRARTETSYDSTEQRTKPGGPSSSKDYDWPSSDADSPSDEDLVVKPGRRASLQKPEILNGGTIITLPKHYYSSSRSRSDGGVNRASFTSKESHQREPDHRAEVVHVDDDGSGGDATSALRKVMKNRQNRMIRPDLNARRLSLDQNAQQKSVSDARTPFPLAHHQHRRTSASNRVSPSRSTSRKGPTRCVCDNLETDGLFMIQCESCANWLHGNCVGINEHDIPVVYICAFCAQTPLGMRVSRMRDGKSGSGVDTSSSMTQNDVER